ncbi:MAG: hypothetical protein ACO1SV_25255 [Fimbriimonas sp.]
MITTLSLAATMIGTYTVSAVDRHVAFAGRLGKRVEITLRLKRGDEVRVVRLARRHTRTGSIPEFRVGETVVLPSGASLIAPESVRRL